MALPNEITCLYLGVINFIYMFWVRGLNMLMFASGIVGSSGIKLRRRRGFPEAATVAIASRAALARS